MAHRACCGWRPAACYLIGALSGSVQIVPKPRQLPGVGLTMRWIAIAPHEQLILPPSSARTSLARSATSQSAGPYTPAAPEMSCAVEVVGHVQ